jgi:hypothetical protein
MKISAAQARRGVTERTDVRPDRERANGIARALTGQG